MRTCPLCPLFIATVLVAAPTAFLIAAAPTQDSTAPSKAAANTGKKAGEKEWAVHDMTRPEPAIVAGGTCTNGGCGAPSDAIVLFDGKDLSQWTANGSDAKWTVTDGYFQATRGAGNIQTKQKFGSCQIHIEWMVPETCKCESQHGCNSGLFFMDRYELQILGSNGNKTYVDGMAGAMYGQHPPLVNACKPNGQWNTYDVVFHAPVFGKDGALTKAGTMTVFFNGVLVQDNAEILGATAHAAKAKYSAHEAELPIGLQDHGDPLKFRNAWIRPLTN